MATEVCVAVAGATGALGREIVAVLDAAKWRPSEVVALASPTTSDGFVDYGETRLSVDNAADADFERIDLLVLATPAAAAGPIGERAVSAGVPVVDCSGAFARDPDARLVVPWINPEALQELPARHLLVVPGAVPTLVASLLAPLVRAGLAGPAHATVLVPASSEGKAGIDELSRQVVALFNQGTPPRKVFPAGLAFDLLPTIGALNEDGHTDAERAAEADAARLLASAVPIGITLVGVPVFSGLCAEVSVQLPRKASPELIARVLADGGLRAPASDNAKALPRPRKAEGVPFAQFGRLRIDPTSGELRVWVVMDNLRTAATAAVACAAVLLQRQRPGEA